MGAIECENVRVCASSTGHVERFTSLLPPHIAVVNEDGTVSRIANWAQLSEREREVALRRIAKRNQQRVAALTAAGVGVDLGGLPVASGGAMRPAAEEQAAALAAASGGAETSEGK